MHQRRSLVTKWGTYVLGIASQAIRHPLNPCADRACPR